nr:MAG TPA: hypothetical protein [Caudoviricetes sp.]
MEIVYCGYFQFVIVRTLPEPEVFVLVSHFWAF